MMERRRSERANAGHDVALTVRGCPAEGHVYDLSMDGCMIETSHGLVAPGDPVVIAFAGPITVEGRIVWHKQRTAGVQFDRSLDRAVVAKLTFQDVAGPADTFRRDRFGREMSVGRGRNTHVRLG